MGVKTLASLWSQLGTDERLGICLEHMNAEVKRLCATPAGPNARPDRTAYLAGYQTALRDLEHYVVEGHLPPEMEEIH